MKLNWHIEENDIKRIVEFIESQNNSFVQTRINRNIKRQNLQLDKNAIIKTLFMCLLTTQQRSGPNSVVGVFLRKKPFPITIESIENIEDIEIIIRNTLLENGLNRYINKIPKFFSSIYNHLNITDWELIKKLTEKLDGSASKITERKIADSISDKFAGFGPKQSRNFLQTLGLTKYEIPIDSRITKWLTEFGFPVTLTSIALQDKGYYHFVSDGIQYLCEKANVYPCVLDAAIFSSYDNGQWSSENTEF